MLHSDALCSLLSQNPVALRAVRTSVEKSVRSDETVLEVRLQGGLTSLVRSRHHKSQAQMGDFQRSERATHPRGQGPSWESIQDLSFTKELPEYAHC